MNMSTFRKVVSAAVLSVAGLSTAAHAATVLDVTQYNAFVIGNYTAQNSDVEGGLIVGGNANLTNYSVGFSLNSSSKGSDTYIVGGNLNATNGQLNEGNLAVGGTITNTGFTVRDGTSTAGVSFDFADLAAQLRTTSGSLSQYANPIAAVDNWGTLQLTGTDANLNVFNVTAAQLSSSNGLVINVTPNSQVLVNVSGTAATWQNMGINLNGLSTANVLFNFYEATSLTMSSVGINGSILAPNADVKFDNGQMNGLLVAANFQGTGELHNTGYKGGLLTPSRPVDPITPGVPEPATWAMMLLGFAVVGGAMRKRRTQPTVSYI